MSEQKKSFMEQLDEWTDENIIDPLHAAITDGDSDDCDAREDQEGSPRQGPRQLPQRPGGASRRNHAERSA